MNECLEQLKQLLMNATPHQRSKFEKADILEMTVAFLKKNYNFKQFNNAGKITFSLYFILLLHFSLFFFLWYYFCFISFYLFKIKLLVWPLIIVTDIWKQKNKMSYYFYANCILQLLNCYTLPFYCLLFFWIIQRKKSSIIWLSFFWLKY